MKNKFLPLMMLLCFACFGAARADVVQIGSTGTYGDLPLKAEFPYYLTQQIYDADEIGTPGTISAISFYFTSTEYSDSFSLDGVQLYLKNVNKDVFTSDTDMVPLSASDKVWEGTYSATGSGWATITLDTPFEYDGSSNLLVGVYDPTDYHTQGYLRFYVDVSQANKALGYYGYYNPDLSNLPNYQGYKWLFDYRPIIRINITPPETVPYYYDFENPGPFANWRVLGGNTRIANYSNCSHSGRRLLSFEGSTSNLVVLPKFASHINDLSLEFWTRPETDGSGCGNFAVGYMTDPGDPSTFVAIETYSYNDWSGDCTYKKKTVDFNSAPEEGYIAMCQYNCSSSWFWYVDDVQVMRDSDPITFADTSVKAICVANWDTNGDGELSYGEAAAVTTFNPGNSPNTSVFYDSNITSFDEMQYFTGLTQSSYASFYYCYDLASVILPPTMQTIDYYTFYDCHGLTQITIPANVTSIGYCAFGHCTGLTSITMEGSTPPQLMTAGNIPPYQAFASVPNTIPVYVPIGSIGAYRTAPGWSEFTNIIEYGNIPFVDANVKAICVANWDTNGDGELSIEEAAEVTTLTVNGTSPFKNTAISWFDELHYFTGLTSIPNEAFYGCSSLYSVYLPIHVTSLGDYAFYGCSTLYSVSWPNAINTLGSHVFQNCTDLTAIGLPASLTSVPEYAFYGCTNLVSVAMQTTTQLETIEKYAFYNCNKLASIDIPATVTYIKTFAFGYCTSLSSLEFPTPNTTLQIGGSVFRGCTGLTSVTFSEGITRIDTQAFAYCTGLTSIAIPASVTVIGTNPFQGCTALASITVDANNQRYDSRNGCNAIILTSNAVLYSGCKTTVVPDDISIISRYAFFGCTGLTSVKIPSSLTEIKEYAFYGCTGLSTMHVETVTPPTLGSYVFTNVPQDIPVFVPCNTEPDYQAATGWGSFTNYVDACDPIVFADDNVKAICVANWDTNGDGELSYDEAAQVTTLNVNGASPFKQNNTITSFDELQYFTGLTSLNASAFYYCTRLTSITFPSSLQQIGAMAFMGCYVLASIPLHEGITSISAQAFDHCTSLTSINIPASVTSIASTTFLACTGLVNITVESGNIFFDSRDNCNAIIRTSTNQLLAGCKNTLIPNTVTSIGQHAFRGNSALTSITLPTSITLIDNYAFYDCTALTTITLPSSLSSIGAKVFHNCTGLQSITVKATTPPTLATGDNDSFDGVNKTIPVYVPCGTVADYEAASGWNEFSNIVADSPYTNLDEANPFFEGFESGNFVPDCWESIPTVINEENEWVLLDHSHTGSFSAFSNYYGDIYLVMPVIQIANYVSKATLSFWSYNTYPEDFEVGNNSVVLLDGDTETVLWSADEVSQSWEENTIDLTAYIGQAITIAFKYAGTNGNGWYIDDVAVLPENCPTPSNVTITSIKSSHVTVNWEGYGDTWFSLYRTDDKEAYDFETGTLQDWNSEGDATWTVGTGDGNNSSSNSVGAHSGNYNAKITHTARGNETWLISPMMNLANMDVVYMNFWYINREWGGDIDELGVYYRIDGGQWHGLWTTNEAHETWTEQQVILFDYADNFQIGFKMKDGYGYGVGLDDIEITALNYAIGFWAYYPAQSLTLTGLQPSTDYMFYMVSECSNNSSPATDWMFFTTRCEAENVNVAHSIVEDFESGSFEPDCWDIIPSSDGYHWTSNTNRYHSSSHSAYSGYNGNTYLVLPELWLASNATEANLKFWSYNTYIDDFQTGNNAVVLLNDDDETVLWMPMTVSDGWQQIIIPLTNYLDQNLTIAFKYSGNNGNGWYIDDVEVSVHYCPTPSNVTITDITSTEATVNWEGEGDAWIVWYKADFNDTYDFETGTLEGWTSQGDAMWTVGTGDDNISYPIGAHSGNYNAKIPHTTYGNETWLISPMMDLTGMDISYMDFWYINRDWSGDYDDLSVYYRVDGGEWHLVFITEEAHEDWTKQRIYFYNYGVNYQIGFKMTDRNGYGVGLDDIQFYAGTLADADWAYAPAHSFTFTDLVPNTTYCYYLMSNCGSSSSGSTDWLTFTTKELTAGWNWWAPTVAMTVGQLETGLGTNGLLINSQEGGFARYEVGEGWSGTLSEIEVGKMYKIETSAACTLSVQGDRPAMVTVTLVPGYTWFGYTGTQAKAIATALGNFGPANGDKIIAQDGTEATYNDGWSGELTTLVPGHGYIYHSVSDTPKTLVLTQ